MCILHRLTFNHLSHWFFSSSLTQTTSSSAMPESVLPSDRTATNLNDRAACFVSTLYVLAMASMKSRCACKCHCPVTFQRHFQLGACRDTNTPCTTKAQIPFLVLFMTFFGCFFRLLGTACLGTIPPFNINILVHFASFPTATMHAMESDADCFIIKTCSWLLIPRYIGLYNYSEIVFLGQML